jgi:hypothetical protein
MKKLNAILALSSIFMAPDKGGKGGAAHTLTKDEVEQARIDEATLRTEYLGGDADWDAEKAPEFGGQSEILVLKIGEVAKGLLYTGFNTSTIGDKPVQVHTANLASGDPVRLPISASFTRALDQASVQVGDTIMVKRYEDATKKGGVGKGQNMAIYAIKVVKKNTAAIAD